jgi:hypothetical protein
MTAIIQSHTNLPEGHEELHRFTFKLHEGGAKAPLTEDISLRTARVIVSHLEDANALIHATSLGDGRPRRLREARWRGISGQFHREWPKRPIARHQPRLEKR